MDLGIKGVILGGHGIGKTSLLNDMPEDSTLAFDMEAGMLAVKDWKGRKHPIRTWQEARIFASLIGGANPSSAPGEPYSKEYYDKCVLHAEKTWPDLEVDKYISYFLDSITESSRLCLAWSKAQAECTTQQGKLDMRKAYGLMGQEMIAWFKQFQRAQGKNVWFVGGLDRKELDGGKVIWEPQIEGSKATAEMPGIFDEVITLTKIDVNRDGKVVPQAAFICHLLNNWGYPAKDRSGTLNLIEEPNLVKLMEKIRTSPRYNARPNWTEILNDEIIY
jgi:hypothetical protein